MMGFDGLTILSSYIMTCFVQFTVQKTYKTVQKYEQSLSMGRTSMTPKDLENYLDKNAHPWVWKYTPTV